VDVKAQLEELERYYCKRAPEYEGIYYRMDPERDAELERVAEAMKWKFKGQSVLEIACGTGYWTEILAGVAKRVVAIDQSAEMFDEARKKNLSPERVELRLGDAYQLDAIEDEFDGAVANFWFSHVPRAKLDEFIGGLHTRIGSGATVFFSDNFDVKGYGGDLVQPEGHADTFKRRVLEDGSSYDVTKNYYDPAELERIFAPRGRDLEIEAGKFYWWLSYRVR